MIENSNNKNVILDGEVVTLEVLTEKKQQLTGSQKIVEVRDGEYQTIERMQG